MLRDRLLIEHVLRLDCGGDAAAPGSPARGRVLWAHRAPLMIALYLERGPRAKVTLLYRPHVAPVRVWR